jgi:hypothetical protein
MSAPLTAGTGGSCDAAGSCHGGTQGTINVP